MGIGGTFRELQDRSSPTLTMMKLRDLVMLFIFHPMNDRIDGGTNSCPLSRPACVLLRLDLDEDLFVVQVPQNSQPEQNIADGKQERTIEVTCQWHKEAIVHG